MRQVTTQEAYEHKKNGEPIMCNHPSNPNLIYIVFPRDNALGISDPNMDLADFKWYVRSEKQ